MTSKSILAITAVLLMGAAAAQAETYQGVHPLTHDATRAAEHVQAVAAAHSPDPFAEGSAAGIPSRISTDTTRSAVRQQAVLAAHLPNPYADGYDASQLVPGFVSTASRASVRAQAVATAHSPKRNVWGESF